jgi:hypothetical protein
MATYDPSDVTTVFAGVEVFGFADGTFISVDKAEDTYSIVVGATGTVTRVRNRNNSGTIKITLQASSGCNDLLSDLHSEDLLNNSLVGPLLIKDVTGTTVVASAESWIVRSSPIEFGKDASNREWVIQCSSLIIHSGGLV